MSGQSAFGTKAGDLFTRITIGTAAVWLLLCMASVKLLTSSASGPFGRAPLAPNGKTWRREPEPVVPL
ncbi:MAG: hypothetical protein U0935_22910 [Pirellulales bacterium]